MSWYLQRKVETHYYTSLPDRWVIICHSSEGGNPEKNNRMPVYTGITSEFLRHAAKFQNILTKPVPDPVHHPHQLVFLPGILKQIKLPVWI